MKEYIAPTLMVIAGVIATYFLCSMIPEDVKCVDGKIYKWVGWNVYKPTNDACISAR